MAKKKVDIESLSIEMVQNEKERILYRQKYLKTVRSTIDILVVVAAVAVLIATMFLPVLRVSGMSMSPTFEDGQILVTYKTSKFETGSLISFYYNNKVLIKRVIAKAGQWVDIDDEGRVYVDKVKLKEDYIVNFSKGSGDVVFPYQVPDNCVFVLGDNRGESIDSRYTEVGPIAKENIIGKIFLRVYPYETMGVIENS